MKMNIYVLCGGKSVEHEVSLKSASAIINSIDKEKYNVYPIYITNEGIWCYSGLQVDKIKEPMDLKNSNDFTIELSMAEFLTTALKANEKNLVFPALHGPNGEDGTIQGFLEILNIPYVGNEVLSSSVAMDKVFTKDLFATHNIPQGDYVSIRNFNWKEDENASYKLVEEKINYPCYVKPANSGSSVGISRVENLEELKLAFKEAFLYDTKIVVEKEIVAREMQVSVIGNNHPKASLPGEFIMERAFFDYNAKYVDGKLIPVVPAKLTDEVTEKVRKYAEESFKVLNCHGLARVDIFVTDENEIFVNEVNTMPGFTPFSMTPVLWEATNGTSYSELVEWLINLALERYKEKSSIINMR